MLLYEIGCIIRSKHILPSDAMEGSMSEEVLYYVQQLRKGDENAYHSLIELDNSYIPELIDLFHQETHSAMQAELLEVIWQHRSPETLSLLQEALHHAAPDVWKTALDGIVALNHPRGIDILAAEISRLQSLTDKAAGEPLEWVIEASGQLQDSLNNPDTEK